MGGGGSPSANHDHGLPYCGVYILLSDDKHRFVRDNSKKSALKIQDKFQLRQNPRIFFQQIFFRMKIFSPQ